MLCLSPRFAQMARMLTMNGLLTMWVIAALATAHQALAEPILKRRWWFLSALACGLGFLTKGPVALVLVAGPVLLLQLLDRRTPRPRLGPWLAYGAVVGAVAIPWFVIVAVRDPCFVEYFVWIHHVRRFLDPIDHLQPVWYYLPGLFMGMMPWTLLLFGLVKDAWRRRVASGEISKPLASPTRHFFLLAALWGLLFFSASGCKRPSYILPVMPPLALALGCHVDAACRAGRIRLAHWAGVAAACYFLLLGAAEFLLPGYAQKYSVRDQIVPHTEACTAADPVLSYPHGWDGVSYYLKRNDVRVFRPRQLGDMMSALQQHPQSLVVVKTDASLDQFLGALPEALQFEPCSCRETIAVGWVRRRPER
jgi:4-amino-4-deoxy-L-arabinose transferase-like glycosyltransferase